MSASVHFVAKKGALKQIANSAEIQAVCLRGALSAAAQASALSGGYPYKTDVQPGKFRCHARATSSSEPAAYWAGVRTQALKRVHPHI